MKGWRLVFRYVHYRHYSYIRLRTDPVAVRPLDIDNCIVDISFKNLNENVLKIL